MAVRLRSFSPLSPMEYLHGAAGEWFFLALFSLLFMAIAGAALPKKLTEHRFGKVLVVSVGLILGVGLFRSRDLFNFNFESFGFLGIGFVVLLMGIITFGLARIGLRKDMALSFSYCLMFLTFRMVSPSLYDAVAESLPILNLIFLVTFVYMAGMLLVKIFGMARGPKQSRYFKEAEKNISMEERSPGDTAEIANEINTEKQEEKVVRKRIMELTRTEVSTVEQIDKFLSEMILVIRGSPGLSESTGQVIIQLLERLGRKKAEFLNCLANIRQHAAQNKQQDFSLAKELEKRLSLARSESIKKEIQKELLLNKKKMRIYEFVDLEEKKMADFFDFFDKKIFQASRFLRSSNSPEAVNILAGLKNRLGTMRDRLEKLLNYENYIRKLSRENQRVLKKEKKEK